MHRSLQAVRLQDPLLRVSVGLRLALHLEAAQSVDSACTLIREVKFMMLTRHRWQTVTLHHCIMNTRLFLQSCTDICTSAAPAALGSKKHVISCHQQQPLLHAAQVVEVAEGFRITMLKHRRGLDNEPTMVISASTSQPTSDMQAIMSGEYVTSRTNLHVTVHYHHCHMVPMD